MIQVDKETREAIIECTREVAMNDESDEFMTRIRYKSCFILVFTNLEMEMHDQQNDGRMSFKLEKN